MSTPLRAVPSPTNPVTPAESLTAPVVMTPDAVMQLVQLLMSPGEIAQHLRLVFTPEEAAAVLRLGRTTVYALMASGELRFAKVGTLRRISLADLQNYIDTHITQVA
ncbi:helix-turn-helix domain-containing protein [Yinghuangia aomiensis]